MAREKFANAYRYHALVDERGFADLVISDTVQKFYDNSYASVVSRFVEEEKMDLDELKAFMRTAKVIEVETPRRVMRRPDHEPSSVTPKPSATPASGKLTMEELDARIKAEMEHEKEMIQRKLTE